MLDVLMRGISTRQYERVLPEMADTCGVSKSNVSREAIEAGEEALKQLVERRFDELDLERVQGTVALAVAAELSRPPSSTLVTL